MLKIKNSAKSKEIVTAYLMLAPDILGLFFFVFIPIVFAFYVSLHNWNGISSMQFIEFDNYKALFKDSDFWASLWITIKYSLMYVPAVFVFALMAALLVNALKGKARGFFRTILFLPYTISTVVAALAWSFLYDPYRGFVNNILKVFGIQGLTFTSMPGQALASVAVVGIWLIFGYNMVIFISGLNEIPKTYYEATVIDGANSFRRFFSITFPLLKDTSLFILTVTTIGSFQVFDQIKVMTNGGPAFSTSVSVYYIFQQAFEVSKFGYSSSIAFVLFIVIMLITLLQFKLISSRKIEY